MASLTTRTMPLRQRSRPSRKSPSASSKHSARVEKSSSTPNSPRTSQLRRKHFRTVPALTDADHSSLIANGVPQNFPLRLPDATVGQRRPVSWHPTAQTSASWDGHSDLHNLPHSSPLINTPFVDDDVHGGFSDYSESLTPFGWSGSHQSAVPYFGAFPQTVGPATFDDPSYTAAALDHWGQGMDTAYMPYCTTQFFDFPPHSSYDMLRPQLPSYTPHDPSQGDFALAARSQPLSTCIAKSENHESSALLQSPKVDMPHQRKKFSPPDDGELVGMGLYDEPENMSSWDPQSDQYQSLLLNGGYLDNGPGKGWKLEETFQPKGEAIDTDQDALSSVGDDNHPSPSLDLDFDDFVPMCRNDFVPQNALDHPALYADRDAPPAWQHDEAFQPFVPMLPGYARMEPFLGYPSM